MTRKKSIAAIVSAAVLGAGIYFVYTRWAISREDSRASLLQSLPANASAVIYADLAELRQGEILKGLSDWRAAATTDPDYKRFVNDTGFDYERDLDRMGIAVVNPGETQNYFAVADGNFNRKRIEDYLRKNGASEQKGGREIFRYAVPNSNRTPTLTERRVSIAFLSDRRLFLTDAADLPAELEANRSSAGRAEWTERFERLSGTPVFVLIRQDAAIGALLNNQAPGGLRSPQLAQLLNQLLWVSIAGKPEGKDFRAVLEGECPNEATMRQLADFLNGIAIMADAGLNDPKLRQQMDPAEREAYVQLLNSMDVMKLDRGKSKSVRVTFVVTPEIWGKLTQAASTKTQEEKVAPGTKANSPANKKKNGGQKQSARRP